MDAAGRDFIALGDWRTDEILALIEDARAAKRGGRLASLAGRRLIAIFFNPSLRTRLSFQIAMERLGGNAIVMNAGGDAWAIEFRDGIPMDGATVEHVKEAARVLDRYADAIAIRSFAAFTSWEEDRADHVVSRFAAEARVPVINMESAMHHPCQGLADAMTIQEELGDPRGRRLLVTWAWHPKPLPLAVCHSALEAAAHLGMEIVLACPPGYEPDEAVFERAAATARANGGSLAVEHDRLRAAAGARVVYAKSWASIGCWGDAEAEARRRNDLRAWQVTGETMAATDDAIFMHCLPVRRNVVAADSVLDSPRSRVYDEAENRIWAQMAVLSAVLGRDGVNA